MKLSLIDIAKSQKNIRSNTCDFEVKIKRGTKTPVFSIERDRIRRKERDLRRLQAQLQGPNAHSLAAHLQDELNIIEFKNSAAADDVDQFQSVNAVPRKQPLPSIGGPLSGPLSMDVDNNNSVHFEGEDGAPISSDNSKERSNLDNSEQTSLVIVKDKNSDDPPKIESEKQEASLETLEISLRHHRPPPRRKDIAEHDMEVKVKHTFKLYNRKPTMMKPHTVVKLPTILPDRSAHAEVAASSILPQEGKDPESTNYASHALFPIPEEGGPQAGGDNSQRPLPAIMTQSSDDPTTKNHEEPVGDSQSVSVTVDHTLPPIQELPSKPAKKSRLRKSRAILQRQLKSKSDAAVITPGTATSADFTVISRHGQRRLDKIRLKTNETVDKVTTSLPELSSGGRESVTSNKSRHSGGLHGSSTPDTVRSDASGRNSGVSYHGKRKHRYQFSVTKNEAAEGEVGIRLPPIRVDTELLKELKRQRIKHRRQSANLPKLP